MHKYIQKDPVNILGKKSLFKLYQNQRVLREMLHIAALFRIRQN